MNQSESPKKNWHLNAFVWLSKVYDRGVCSIVYWRFSIYLLMGNWRPIEGFIKGPLKSIKGLLKAYHRFIMGLSIYLSLEVCFWKSIFRGLLWYKYLEFRTRDMKPASRTLHEWKIHQLDWFLLETLRPTFLEAALAGKQWIFCMCPKYDMYLNATSLFFILSEKILLKVCCAVLYELAVL